MEPNLRTRRSSGAGSGRARARFVPYRPEPKPVVWPGSRASAYFPLVMLVAILPGLFALRSWDLNPPGPWWGLRGLAVLDGYRLDQAPAADGLGRESEALAFRAVALQPPLYAWLEAIGLGLSPSRSPLGAILPSYLAGVLVVILVYRQGRVWGGPGQGLVAALLTGFSRDLLAQMQQPSPATLGLAGALVAVWSYAEYLRSGVAWDRRWGWAVLSGLGLGVSLMTVRLLALAVIPIVLLHQAALGPDPVPAACRSWRAFRRERSGLLVGLAALALGLLVAAPWYGYMLATHGRSFLEAQWDPPELFRPIPGGFLLAGMVMAPATLALAAHGAWRAVRRWLTAETEDAGAIGGALWVIWLVVAAVAPAVVPGRPGPSSLLFLLVPINLLAARSILDLARRRASAKALVILAPATALTVAWWASSHVRQALADLLALHRPDAASALGLHLGLDLLVLIGVGTWALDRWSRRRDDRQRSVLAGFLIAVLATNVAIGIREARFRHRQTYELLTLSDIIERRQQIRPFDLVAVIGPEGPTAPDTEALHAGGQLRFLLRTSLPDLQPRDLTRTDELLDLPDGCRLVILAGTRQQLPYGVQSRLGLEAIHPSRNGMLDVFASLPPDPRP